MNFYILDASVILSFLLERQVSVSRKFRKILKEAKDGKVKLCSTHLLPLEIGNGLRFSLVDEEIAGEIFKKLFKLPIDLVAFSSPQLEKILKLSYYFKTSVYDTSYHFLAKLRKGTFLLATPAISEKQRILATLNSCEFRETPVRKYAYFLIYCNCFKANTARLCPGG